MSIINACVITTTGHVSRKMLDNNNLKSYQEIVGGWIEAVSGTGFVIYVNEEGKIQGLSQNPLADSFARLHGMRIAEWDVLTGDVVFVGAPDAQGYDTSFPEELFKKLGL